MKTKPIGIRFEPDEYEQISDYARRSGETFSQVVREGALAYVDPDRGKGYRSLAELAAAVEPSEMNLAFSQFLDDFAHAEHKEALVVEEPLWASEPGRWRYDFAATAHKLSHDHGLPVPHWALRDEYVATAPVYAFGTTNPQFQEYLRQTTPREFQWHNLFLGENVLTRA